MREHGVAQGRLAGRVAIVTGAASGMGAAAARALAREGARVVAADLDLAAAEATAAQMAAGGGEALAVEVDVSRAADVRRMVGAAVDRFGTIDVLACIAGILRTSRADQIAEDEWDLVLDVNLKGVFLCCQAVLPIMRARRAGKIVILASLAGRATSTLGGAHYTASKAGVLGLSRHLARELAPVGINVNAINPGIIDTPMVRAHTSPERLARVIESIPFKRLGTAEEVAGLVVFLASDASSYITGAAIDIHGGELII
jgi:NAD(P)-dependent dehydrogenase (short-subunit alcohol dehydrogenase family)